MPKISVIIPVYNTEKFLPKCLDSVINQTLKDIEIICVNDGSKDNSLSILEEYFKKDNRIKIINQENEGLSGARNTGVEHINSKYCYFLDSDDYIEPDLFETAYDALENNDADYYCFTSKPFCDDNPTQNLQSMQNYLNVKYQGIVDTYFNVGLDQNIQVWNKIFKTSIIKENNIKFIPNLLYEDIFFTWYYFFLSKKIYFEPKAFHNYRIHQNSIMEKTTKEKTYDSAVCHLLNFYELFLKISNNDELFFKNYENLLVLLKNYKKRTIQMAPTKDKKRIELLAKNYKKEIDKAFIKKFSYIKFLFKSQNIFKITKQHKRVEICLFNLKLKLKSKYFKLKYILKKIFSITNDGNYKKITICFVKIKIKAKLFLKIKYLIRPINKNKIVFCNFWGKSYGCNPKYICDEIIRQNLPYELVWLVSDTSKEAKKQYPKQIKLVNHNSKEAMDELLSAKLWVDNARKFMYDKGLYKRKNQKYIQTWHGSLGIKKVEDAVEGLDKYYVKIAKIDSQNIDYIISNSLYDDKMFSQDFWYKGKIVKTGHPRSDIFFCNEEERIEITKKVKTQHSIDKDKKIILYVPSFRDDHSLSAYNIDTDAVLKTLEEKFGDSWVFMIRLHPNLSSSSQNYFKYSDKVINMTSYPDVLELLLASDMVITDYSSCIFDFMFTKKPAFIYASDLEKYNTQRGFYYPLETAPFSIAKTNEELKQNILNFESNEYISKINAFLDKYKCIEDGQSSKRTVELIKKIMEGKED